MQQTIKMPSPEVNPLEQRTLHVPTRSVLRLNVTASMHHTFPVIIGLFSSNTQTRFSIDRDKLTSKSLHWKYLRVFHLGLLAYITYMTYNRRFKQTRVIAEDGMIRRLKEHPFMQDHANWVVWMRNLRICNVVFVTQRNHPPWNMVNGWDTEHSGTSTFTHVYCLLYVCIVTKMVPDCTPSCIGDLATLLQRCWAVEAGESTCTLHECM